MLLEQLYLLEHVGLKIFLPIIHAYAPRAAAARAIRQPTADLKLEVKETHAILAVAMAIKSSQ